MVDRRDGEAVRQDLERFWDNKLQHARERYFRAAAEFHRHVQETGGLPQPDSCAIADVRRAEAEAFADYCRVLATFTELVAGGKLPRPQGQTATVTPTALE